MYQFEKMNKKLLGVQVEEELMNFILGEPVEVGRKIPNEFELAEKFGVGRSTIREAVKGLVTKGILEVRRGAGTYVVSTSTSEEDPLGLARLGDRYKLALELLDVRMMLEPEIAAMACGHITQEEKARLEQLCNEVEQLYRSGINHASKDVEFHTHIAKCSGNRVVEILIPVINTAVLTFVNLTQRQLMKETLETHRAITDSIMKGDSVGAKAAMVMHLNYNRQKILQIYENHMKDNENQESSKNI